MIHSTDLPKSLQFFVSNCEARASVDPNEKSKIAIFDKYECFNSIFGDAESIFMGRSINDGSTTDYKFSFPAFTFNNFENSPLFMVSDSHGRSDHSGVEFEVTFFYFSFALLQFVLLMMTVLLHLILIRGARFFHILTSGRISPYETTLS